MKTAFLAAAIGLAAAGAVSAQTATPPTADTSGASPTAPAGGAMTTAPAATTTTTAPSATTTTTAPATMANPDPAASTTAATGGAAVTMAPLEPQDFVNMAASSGMFEVMSSELAIERSASPEIKEFAQQMVADHTKANDELKVVAAANNLQVPAEPMGAAADHWQALQDADAGVFDQTYMDLQAQAHAEAIDLFSAEAQATTNAELAAFAQKTLPVLQMHAEHLQDLAN